MPFSLMFLSVLLSLVSKRRFLVCATLGYRIPWTALMFSEFCLVLVLLSSFFFLDKIHVT